MLTKMHRGIAILFFAEGRWSDTVSLSYPLDGFCFELVSFLNAIAEERDATVVDKYDEFGLCEELDCEMASTLSRIYG